MSSRARSVRSIVIPAPTLGKNSRDSIDNMEIGYAIESRNFIPRNDRYSLRRGYASFCTGLGGGVYSLFTHKDTDGTERLLAGANGNIWNVSTGTASSLVSGRSNNRWQTTQLDGATVMCNGADTPYYYTIAAGLTATSYSGSGLTPSTLVQVTSYKGRLYFVEKDTANMWYGGDGAFASGTLTKFPVGKLFSRGGDLEWVASWTRDTGSSSSELLILMSANGEILVYSGSFPGAADWTIVGKFYVGKPLGRRSYFWIGPDLHIISVNGVFPLSSVLQLGQVNEYSAISGTISGDFAFATSTYLAQDDWSGMVFEQDQFGLINIPISSTSSYQYIFNPQSRAWSEFRGLNARQFSVFNDQLYFGDGAGTVYLYDNNVRADAGNAIDGRLYWAYNYLDPQNGRSYTKRVLRMRPLAKLYGEVSLDVGVDYDYRDTADFSTKTIGSPGTLWNTAKWNTFKWAGGLAQVRSEFGGMGRGMAVQPRIKGEFSGVDLEILAIGLNYTTGGLR